MPGYKRIVSYIYTYEKGERKENVGFVKLEARDEEWRIAIHMRGSYAHGQIPYKAYLYAPREDDIVGVFLGELEDRNGALEWKGSLRAEDLKGMPYSLKDIRGIWIGGVRGKRYASEWEDYPVKVDSFQVYEKMPEMPFEQAKMQHGQTKIESREVASLKEETEQYKQAEIQDAQKQEWMELQQEQAAQPEKQMELQEQAVQSEKQTELQEQAVQLEKQTEMQEEQVIQLQKQTEPQQEQVGQQQEQAAQPEKQKKLQQEQANQPQKQTEMQQEQADQFQEQAGLQQQEQADLQSAQIEDELPVQEEKALDASEKAQISNRDSRQEKWDYLAGRFPVQRLFQNGKAPMSCIRIGPRDLQRLPRGNWILGNNSFLLHGYYQYRHLLLCRQEENGKTEYYLAVPGIYNEREKMMADLFGFVEFRRSRNAGNRGGNYGYWFRKIEEAPEEV